MYLGPIFWVKYALLLFVIIVHYCYYYYYLELFNGK